MIKINRNDLCWCGSNKKYKTCHLRSDEMLDNLKQQGYEILKRELILYENHLKGIKKSAEITKGLLDMVENTISAGCKTIEIDKSIYDYTVSKGGKPATLGYKGYQHSCCISINNVVCHGIPNDYVLKDGDIVNVDVTTNLEGYFSDASRMFKIGEVSDSASRLVDCTKECLEIGVHAVKPFRPVNDIGDAIEPFAKSMGYSVVRDLGGHGIGLKFHNEPHINHFITREKGMIMVPGMVFTIEPMINEGTSEVCLLDDGWAITTADGQLSAQWEHTILVTNTGCEIIV